MSGLSGIGSLISGVGSVGIGIGNAISNSQINKKNYELQKDWQNYQKQLQREIFQREDSAIQRRASDIAAAGGNPAMAWETGNGAGAGNIVDTSAPQQAPNDYSQLMNSSLAMFAGGLKQFQESRLIDAQIKNLSAVTDKTDAETITEEIRQLQLKALTAKTNEEKNLYIQEIKEKQHNLELSKNEQLRTNDNKMPLYNSAEAFFNSKIPDNIDNFNAKDLAKIAFEVGLFAIPGIATAKLGAKGVKLALKLLKNAGLPKQPKEFIAFFRRLTGKPPTGKQIEQYRKLSESYSGNTYNNLIRDKHKEYTYDSYYDYITHMNNIK